MISATFDQGWGPEWPTKKYEAQILNNYLAPVMADSRSWIMINSTWYSRQLHDQVLQHCRDHACHGILLVSMMDAGIVDRHWFAGLDCEIHEIGYYRGAHDIDFWALYTADHMQLDSYHDLDDVRELDTAYMCLNRKPHWHRRRLYRELENLDLTGHGLVSMGSDDGQPPVRLLPQDLGGSDHAPNGGTEQHGIRNDILSLGHPLNWKRHLLNIVTETVFDVDAVGFVSEKIYKPILGRRPFWIYAPNGAQTWLRSRGMVTYVDDFRDVTNHDPSDPAQLTLALADVVAAGPAYWRSKLVALQPKIMYNLTQYQIYITDQKHKINRGIKCQI